jgi:hypothetical protein
MESILVILRWQKYKEKARVIAHTGFHIGITPSDSS